MSVRLWSLCSAVAEHQRQPRSRVDAGLQQLVPVGGQLQQRGDLGMAGQLGVEDGVAGPAVLLGPDQEVGPAMELPSKKAAWNTTSAPDRSAAMDSSCLAGRSRGPRPGRERRRTPRATPEPNADSAGYCSQHPAFVHVAQLPPCVEHLVRREAGTGERPSFSSSLRSNWYSHSAAVTRSLAV